MHEQPQKCKHTRECKHTQHDYSAVCVQTCSLTLAKKQKGAPLTQKQARSPPSQTSRRRHTQRDSRCTCSNIPACTHGHANIHTHKRRTHSYAHNAHKCSYAQTSLCSQTRGLVHKNVHMHNWVSTCTHARKYKCAWAHKHAHTAEPTRVHKYAYSCVHALAYMCEQACSPTQMCMCTHHTCVHIEICKFAHANAYAKAHPCSHNTQTCISTCITSWTSKCAHKPHGQAHTHIQKHTLVQTWSHSFTHKHTCPYTMMLTCPHKHICIRTHKHVHSPTQKHVYTHTQIRRHARIHTRPNTPWWTHTYALADTNECTGLDSRTCKCKAVTHSWRHAHRCSSTRKTVLLYSHQKHPNTHTWTCRNMHTHAQCICLIFFTSFEKCI
jgi:hypothetical protein